MKVFIVPSFQAIISSVVNSCNNQFLCIGDSPSIPEISADPEGPDSRGSKTYNFTKILLV
jgi:hypothetical protein